MPLLWSEFWMQLERCCMIENLSLYGAVFLNIIASYVAWRAKRDYEKLKKQYFYYVELLETVAQKCEKEH